MNCSVADYLSTGSKEKQTAEVEEHDNYTLDSTEKEASDSDSDSTEVDQHILDVELLGSKGDTDTERISSEVRFLVKDGTSNQRRFVFDPERPYHDDDPRATWTSLSPLMAVAFPSDDVPTVPYSPIGFESPVAVIVTR